MGPSASGNKPRFDNDQTDSIPSVPSKRLRNVLSIDDDNSLQSNSSFTNLGMSGITLDNVASVVNQIGADTFSQIFMQQPSSGTQAIAMSSSQSPAQMAHSLTDAQNTTQNILMQASTSAVQAPSVSRATNPSTRSTRSTTTTSLATQPSTSAISAAPVLRTTPLPSRATSSRLQNRATSEHSAVRPTSRTPTPQVASNIRDIQARNVDLMREHLTQQSENNSLQKKYLELQVGRAEIALEREKILLEKEKILLEKEKLSLERLQNI